MGGRLTYGAVGSLDVAAEDSLGTAAAVVGALYHECAVVHVVLEEAEVVVAISLDKLRRLEVAANHPSNLGLLPKDWSDLAQFEYQ